MGGQPGGVEGTGGLVWGTVSNHHRPRPVEGASSNTPEPRAAVRLTHQGTTPRLAWGSRWGQGGPGSPGFPELDIENLGPHHNGPRFRG